MEDWLKYQISPLVKHIKTKSDLHFDRQTQNCRNLIWNKKAVTTVLRLTIVMQVTPICFSIFTSLLHKQWSDRIHWWTNYVLLGLVGELSTCYVNNGVNVIVADVCEKVGGVSDWNMCLWVDGWGNKPSLLQLPSSFHYYITPFLLMNTYWT